MLLLYTLRYVTTTLHNKRLAIITDIVVKSANNAHRRVTLCDATVYSKTRLTSTMHPFAVVNGIH